MINISFTEFDINELQYERFNHPHPRVQLKMEVLLLKSKGLRHKEICRLTDISGNTLRSYIKDYQQGGLEKIKEIKFYKPESDLVKHKTTIETYFKEHPPASVKEAMAKIEGLTGIKRSRNRVRKFLMSIGMKFRKVGMIPAKADPDKQDEFVKEELTPRLDEAENGKRVVFFTDAAHFVLSPFLGFLWSFTRVFY